MYYRLVSFLCSSFYTYLCSLLKSILKEFKVGNYKLGEGLGEGSSLLSSTFFAY